MPVPSAQAAKAFVAGAGLAPLPRLFAGAPGEPPSPPLELIGTDAQALVVGSALVFAARDVPRQTREDLVHCTLFAQLAASAKVTEPKRVAEWYGAYFDALTALGFVQRDARFEHFESSGTTLEAHEAILSVLTDLLGPGADALSLVTDTFEALRSMRQNGPWVALFDRQSRVAESARFQVATAEPAGPDQVELSLVAFDLESKVSLTQVLFFKFGASQTRLSYARGRAFLLEEALGPVRDQVSERLRAYRAAYVGAVALPPVG